MAARTLLPLALLATLALAGCSGNSPAASSNPAPGSDGPPGAATSASDAAGAEPHWAKGQTWTHDYTIGTNTVFSVKSIVVDNATGYRLAADEKEDAVNHAAFFFHDLGQMDKDWIVHQGGYQFPWYNFPLTDGKTWTAHEENLDGNLQPVSRDLTAKATFVPALGGVPAHYAIQQRTSDGNLRADYDYRSDLGWFSAMTLYDPTVPGDVPQVTVKTSATGHDYKGDYLEAQADFVLNYFSFTAPLSGQVVPQPEASFPITADDTDVMFISFAFAAVGASHTELVAPDGQHWESSAVADQDGNNVVGNGGLQVIVPAVAGDWRVVSGGASPFAAGGGVFAWGVQVTKGTL
jgi:hypothetical protein